MNALRPQDPRHRLLLEATLAPDERARRAYAAWRPGVDVDTLDLPQIRLLPALARRRHDDHADDLALRLKKVARFAWLRGQLLLRDTLPAVEALAEAGLDPMIAKGGAVLAHAGDQAALRPMDDLDVVVPAGHLATATATLCDRGWSTPLSPLLWAQPELVAASIHAVPFKSPGGATIDLHAHVLADHLDDQADLLFREHAVPATLHHRSVIATGPEHTLIHAIVHAWSWTPNLPLHWALDASLLADRGLDWAAVRRHARELGVSSAVADGLDALAELEAAPVPDDVRAAVRRDARRRRTVRRRRSTPDLPAPRLPPATPVPLDELVPALLRGDGVGSPYLVSGWHYPEPDGTWSRDDVATVTLPLAEATSGPLLLELEVVPFVTSHLPVLDVTVREGRRSLVSWSFHGLAPSAQWRAVLIPGRPDRTEVGVELEIRSPRTGREARFNGDLRPMGIAIRQLRLRDATVAPYAPDATPIPSRQVVAAAKAARAAARAAQLTASPAAAPPTRSHP